MRTTLTLDDDVERQLRRLCQQRRAPFKQVVNDALRVGLARLLTAEPRRRKPYRTKPVSLGRPVLPDLDNISEVLAVGEGEHHR